MGALKLGVASVVLRVEGVLECKACARTRYRFRRHSLGFLYIVGF